MSAGPIVPLSLVASLRVWKRPRDVVERPLQDAVDGALLRNTQREEDKKIVASESR